MGKSAAAEGGQAGGRKPIGWKPIALDGGYGWVVVLGSFLIHVFADGFVYSFGVIAESLIKEFNATNAEVSTVLSLLTGLMLATGPVASAVCNRIGCRITTIMGAIIASIGCAISYEATSMSYLILSVGIVMGTGFGFMYCPAIVIVTMYFERYRSLATGVTVCGAGVGTFLFSKIIGLLIVNFDWRTVFLIYAVMVLLCVPCGALYRPIEFAPIYEDDNEEEMKVIRSDNANDDEHDVMLTFSDEDTGHLLSGKSLQNGTSTASRKKNPTVPVSGHTAADTILEEEGTDTDEEGGGLNKNFERFERTQSKNNGHAIRSSISQVLASDDASKVAGSGVLQRFRSLGDHLHFKSSGAGHPTVHHHHNGGRLGASRGAGVSGAEKKTISISTGYLNVKDVFYYRSVTALPEYAENQQRFRSISSLHSQRDGPHSVATGGKSLRPRSETAGSRTPSRQKTENEASDRAELISTDTKDTKKITSSEKINGGTKEIFELQNRVREESEHDSTATTGSRAIEIWRTIKRLMDLSLLVDPIYLLFAISNFLTSIGFNAPPMFMPMNAETVLGFSKVDAASTVSAYGLANTFGRIAFGVLCDRKLPFSWGRDCARNRLWIYILTLMLCGLVSCFVFYIESFVAYAGYCFFFGFTISSYVCLTSVVLVDLVGVDRLTNAFGLLLFIQGVATFVGPPIAGQLYDLTKRYDWTFAFCGVCLFISGIMLFAIPPIRRRKGYTPPTPNIHGDSDDVLAIGDDLIHKPKNNRLDNIESTPNGNGETTRLDEPTKTPLV